MILWLCLATLSPMTGCQAAKTGSATTDSPRSIPNNQGVPAGRTANETYEEARARHHGDPSNIHHGVSESETPEAVARKLSQLDLAALPVWVSAEALQKGFAAAKNDLFLSDTSHDPSIRRRIPWQYPDDGCFTRAELARDHLAQNGNPEPKKLFVFGSLSVDTPNAVGGTAYWWYHVAPVVRVGEDGFVLDPAVDPQGPLRIGDWLERMAADLPEPLLSICDATAYDAYSACLGGTPEFARQEAQADLPVLLQNEWERLIELKRDPRAELAQ